MKEWIWIIPLLPFLGAFLNGVVFRHRLSNKGAAAIACGSVATVCLLAIGTIASYLAGAEYAAKQAFEKVLYIWIPAGALGVLGDTFVDLNIEFGFLLDPLSCVMLFVVTFIGTLIHIYSVGYMSHEDGFQRFFTYLNLFMGMMLLLILGNNYLVMFVGWEGVGLCSYLLIGFYYTEEFPPYAGRKAFIVNRIGDFAFITGIFALVAHFGSLNYRDVVAGAVANPHALEQPYLLGLTSAGFITMCLFVGAMGKSAQIPLYVWLPDAMAGPTPVSALIHAATMVTAGVYMVVRSNALFQLAPGTSLFVAVIGTLTAVFAGSIGLAQTDIKKVLAYSTVSQLGYMFLGAGVGAYSAAVFHVGTHAFFKALLFLGSGSVIHAMGGEQDMRKMGGLRKWLPTTYWTFMVGTIAIAGLPPLAGFFSKDQILAAAFGEHKILWTVGLVTAGMTACYMFRAVFMTFFGSFRGTEDQRHHLHESPPSMTVPLMILAVGSIFVGWIGVPRIGDFDINWFSHFLEPVIADVHHGEHHGHHASALTELTLMAVSIAVALLGIFIAFKNYGGDKGLEGGKAWAAKFPVFHRLLENKYYVDEIYGATFIKGTWASARQLFNFDRWIIDGLLVNGSRHLTVGISEMSGIFDKYVVDGIVNLVGWFMRAGSWVFRRLQSGLVSNYAFVMVLGMFVLVCFYLVTRAG